MSRKISLLILGICSLLAACTKSEDDRPCNVMPAGSALRFRITNTAGKDFIYANGSNPDISQPCRTTPLVPAFIPYEIPGTTDTGILISFIGIRTPTYGEAGECFRIFFSWVSGDVDTVDWHYRIEEADGCARQTIDYLSYNGIQAEFKNDTRYSYYRLIK